MASDNNTQITHNIHKAHKHHNNPDIDQDGLVLVNRLNQSRSPYVGLSRVGAGASNPDTKANGCLLYVERSGATWITQ